MADRSGKPGPDSSGKPAKSGKPGKNGKPAKNGKNGKSLLSRLQPKNNGKEAEKNHVEEHLKHIPKRVIEERFLSGRYQQPHRSIGQRAADFTTRYVGSWKFILLLFVFMAIWMYMNIYLVTVQKWDPYPFILLNFVLSCLAAVQAPIILMSQNRQTELDRMKAERDFSVNRKAEKEIEDMQKDLEIIKSMIRKIGGEKVK
jgi:uncharacterized membrane protein